MSYRPMLNMDTAKGWDDVKFGEPIPAELSYHTVTQVWTLTLRSQAINVTDFVRGDDMDEGVSLIDVNDMCLTKAGYEAVMALGYGHLLRA